MCGIDEDRWCGAHPLQPTRTRCRRETRTDGVDIKLTLRSGAEECFDGCQRDRGIVRLMRTMQRKEDVRIHPAEALKLDQLAANGDLPTENRELGVLSRYRGVGAYRMGQKDFHGFRCLAPDDRDGVDWHKLTAGRTDDARLLRRNLGDGLAQKLGVIDADRRDDRDRGIDHVGGIPTTAHTGLDNGNVDRRIGEGGKSHRREDLELAHRRTVRSKLARLRLRIDYLHERLYFTIGFDIPSRADRLIVDGNALDGGLQVWACGPAGPPIESSQQRIDHPGDRCLAVGAGDVNAGITELRGAEQFH